MFIEGDSVGFLSEPMLVNVGVCTSYWMQRIRGCGCERWDGAEHVKCFESKLESGVYNLPYMLNNPPDWPDWWGLIVMIFKLKATFVLFSEFEKITLFEKVNVWNAATLSVLKMLSLSCASDSLPLSVWISLSVVLVNHISVMLTFNFCIVTLMTCLSPFIDAFSRPLLISYCERMPLM